MTDDFSRTYRGVPYFGLWADETADDFGMRDAALVLAACVERCADEDMRLDAEVIAALAYLSSCGHGKRTVAFRRALDLQQPDDRRHAAAEILTALRRDLVLA